MEQSEGAQITADTGSDPDLKQKIEAVQKLLEEAKGENRSYSAYARASGISATAMSRFKNGDCLPSAATMKKLTSSTAAPQGGITFGDFMHAAGYDYNVEVQIDYKEESQIDSENEDYSLNTSAHSESYVSVRARRYREAGLMYEKEVQSQIYTALVNKGVVFKKKDIDLELEAGNLAYRMIDLPIEIMNQKISEWLFMFRYAPPEKMGLNPAFIFASLGYALRLHPSKDTKLSLVINSERVFQILKRYDHALAFKGELSVILYDSEKKEFVEECYLSNYFDEKTERELYIVE